MIFKMRVKREREREGRRGRGGERRRRRKRETERGREGGREKEGDFIVRPIFRACNDYILHCHRFPG